MTLNIYLQTQLADGINYTDFAAFSQVSGIARKVMSFVGGGNTEYAATDGTLAAGTMRNHLLGRNIRAKFTIGGTNPSFTFALYGDFYA